MRGGDVQREMDFIRELLFRVAGLALNGHFHDLSFRNHTDEEIAHQLMLFAEAGFVKLVDVSDDGRIHWESASLTDSGQEFLDGARSDAVWKEANTWTLAKSGTLALGS